MLMAGWSVDKSAIAGRQAPGYSAWKLKVTRPSLSGSRVSSPAFVIAPGDLTINSKLQAFGLFTGQIGYAWNNVLLYAKGGAAVVDNRFSHTFTGTNVDQYIE
jgi:hypothetical protein